MCILKKRVGSAENYHNSYLLLLNCFLTDHLRSYLDSVLPEMLSLQPLRFVGQPLTTKPHRSVQNQCWGT